MKRDALNHPKMLDLASRLDISRAQAIGIMTLLFDFTATYAAQGDIGKLRNGAIARACEWMTDADSFIAALVDSGWLDRDEKHRLVVHDWSDHCEQWVKLKLQKLNLEFLPKSRVQGTAEDSAEDSAERSIEPSAEASASRDLAKPSPNPDPSPNVVKPLKEGKCASADASPPPPSAGELLDAWNSTMGQACVMTEKRQKALKIRLKDHRWLKQWQAALARCSASDFCRGVNDRGWVADFEWFIKPESVTRLLEGKYDNRQGVPRQKTFADMRVDGSSKAIQDFANG